MPGQSRSVPPTPSPSPTPAPAPIAASAGLGTAGASALVGAFLGFIVGGGIMGVITAIVGAAALGNLGLLVLAMSWDRRGRVRFDEIAGGLVPEPSFQPTEVGAGTDVS